MRTIPELRDRLHEMAHEFGIPELGTIAEEMKRRRPARRAPPQYRAVTDEVRAEIEQLVEDHPEKTYQEIAESVWVNIGRVSEVISGKRGDA